MTRFALFLTLLGTATAHAQPPEAPLEEEAAPPEPARGDFDAGGQLRFTGGPDAMGQFATFNWVAVDLQARYFLLKTVTLDANVPLAVEKPATAGPMGPAPETLGGGTLTLDARMHSPPLPGVDYDANIGVVLTGGYMREGAMLLSPKDTPLYTGDMAFGFAGGVLSTLKVSRLLEISLLPTWVYQAGGMRDSQTAIQIPMALGVQIGALTRLNAELGLYSGDNYSFGGSDGGRIATGASLDIRLGHVLLGTGAGVASLITGGLYPSVGDSFYVDVNARYAK